MKNKIILFVLALGSICLTMAQMPFKKIVSGANGRLVKQRQNNYYILGSETVTSIDSLGNVNSKFAWTSTLASTQVDWLTLLESNSLIVVGAESPPYGNFIIKSDSNGMIIWKYVLDSIYIDERDIIACSDGSIVIPGSAYGGTPFAGYASLYKLDSMGFVIWHKYYNSNFWSGRNIGYETIDQNYILGLSHSPDLGFGLLKLDTAGDVLWCKTYFRAATFRLMQMRENPDGSIILLGITNPKTTWNTPQSIFLMKVDSAGSFIWCKSYGDFFGSFYGGSYTLQHASDSGYIISAPITPLTRSGSDLMIIKTDIAGNLEWSRSHGENGTNETSIDAFPTSDGGYFVVGTTDAGIPGPGYYIIKTDSLGFAGCQEYTDTLIVNNIFTTDSAIAITDTLVPVLTFNSSIQDTILPLPSVYNGCLLNTSQSHDFTRSKSFAYPNPSNGIVKIKSSETFTKGSYLTVYDSMGRIIIQKPIAKEEDKQLDLTRQGSGIYLIRIKEGEKVSESKVVVE